METIEQQVAALAATVAALESKVAIVEAKVGIVNTPPVPVLPLLLIDDIYPNDDSFAVKAHWHGAVCYRVCPATMDDFCKYGVDGLIEVNGRVPGDLFIMEALDGPGPYSDQSNPAMIDGMMQINGQGSADSKPNVIARSLPFKGQYKAVTYPVGAFFDGFHTTEPVTPIPFHGNVYPFGDFVNNPQYFWKERHGQWNIAYYGCSKVSRVFDMHGHRMSLCAPAGRPGEGTSYGFDTANASIVMTAPFVGDVQDGKKVSFSFEVDAHNDGRRWQRLIIKNYCDPIVEAGKFDERLQSTHNQWTNYCTLSGTALVWDITGGGHDLNYYEAGKRYSLIPDNGAHWAEWYTFRRQFWENTDVALDGTVFPNGTDADLDRRHKFTLTLSTNSVHIEETDCMGNVLRSLDAIIPTGLVFNLSKVQFGLEHQAYHLTLDPQENAKTENDVWIHDELDQDIRHWDNVLITQL